MPLGTKSSDGFRGREVYTFKFSFKKKIEYKCVFFGGGRPFNLGAIYHEKVDFSQQL